MVVPTSWKVTDMPHPAEHTKKHIVNVIIWLALSFYLILGLHTQLKLIAIKPLPQYFLQDFRYFSRALTNTLEGKDPYAYRKIGKAFLYPPPALLIIEPFARIPSLLTRISIYTVVNIVFMLLMIYGVAYRYGYSISDVWWWFPLGVGFAPFLELLHIGQINMICLFAIFLMFFLQNSSPACSGLGLSLGIVTKVTPIAFVGYLLATRNPRAILGTIVGVLILCGITAMRYDHTLFVTYIDVFGGLMNKFPRGTNSQSFVARLISYHWISDIRMAQKILTGYILLVLVVSAILTFFSKERESLLIIVSFATTLAPNIMWYHHYVFLLLGLFVWMGSRRLKPVVTIWCWVGFLIIQVEPRAWTYGLITHIFGHVSILAILISQLHWAFGQAGPFRLQRQAVAGQKDCPTLLDRTRTKPRRRTRH